MKYFTILLLLITSYSIANTQSNERFIRILGNASETYFADNMTVNLTLTEVARDEYRQIRYKSVEDVIAEVNLGLKEFGLSLTDNAEEVFPPQSNYNSTPQIGYTLNVKDIEQAKKVYGLQIQGLKVNNYSYVFNDDLKLDENKMAFEALKDAKRKAESIAAEIGKKVGKVLNIDDKASGTLRSPTSGRNNKHSVKYSITVTYELID